MKILLHLPKILKIFVSLCKECWVSFHLYLSFDSHVDWFLLLFWFLFFISITWNFFIILNFLLVLICFPIYQKLRLYMIFDIDLPPKKHCIFKFSNWHQKVSKLTNDYFLLNVSPIYFLHLSGRIKD